MSTVRILEAVESTVSAPDAAADAALADAFDYAAEKMGLGLESIAERLSGGDSTVLGYVQYALARSVADYLAAFDGEVRAVYVYDYDATPEDLAFGTEQGVFLVHMLVCARRKTEALYSLISSLDRALASRFAVRAGAPKAAHLLDAHVIDEGELQRGKGYAALLHSIHQLPMLVWTK